VALQLQLRRLVMVPARLALLSRDLTLAESLRAALGSSMAIVPCRGGDDLENADVVVLENVDHEEEERLIARLRRTAPLAEVVVIATQRPVEEAMSTLRAGVFAVLIHPVAIVDLVNAITGALARKRRAEARIRQLESQEAPRPPSSASTPRRNP